MSNIWFNYRPLIIHGHFWRTAGHPVTYNLGKSELVLAGELVLAEEGEDRRVERCCELPLEPGRGQQAGIGRVGHVATFDEHLRHRREVQPGQIVAELDAVAAVVVAYRHARMLQHCRPDIVAEPFR